MKKPEEKDKARKTGALLLSLTVHGLLLWFIVTTTLDLTLPQGNVSITEVEFSPTEAPLGSQVETPNPGPRQTEVETLPAPAEQSHVAPTTESAPAQEETAVAQNVSEKGQLPVKRKLRKKKKNPNVAPHPEKLEEDLDREVEEIQSADTDKLDIAKSEKLDPRRTEEPAKTSEDSHPVSESTQVEPQPAQNPENFGAPTGVRRESQIRALPGNVPPKYSVFARLRRWEGTTSLRFMITKSGNVEWVKVTKSSGYTGLDDAARDAYLKYRYQPGQEGEVLADVVFRLTGPASQVPSELRRRK